MPTFKVKVRKAGSDEIIIDQTVVADDMIDAAHRTLEPFKTDSRVVDAEGWDVNILKVGDA